MPQKKRLIFTPSETLWKPPKTPYFSNPIQSHKTAHEQLLVKPLFFKPKAALLDPREDGIRFFGWRHRGGRGAPEAADAVGVRRRTRRPGKVQSFWLDKLFLHSFIWAMVNTHYMVDGHPIHNKDPYNGYYKSLWTIGWLAPINGY